jgi:hypothetical protein
LATIPTLKTWNAGETVTAATLNANVRDAGNFYKAVPAAYAYMTAAASVASGASWTVIALDTENYDNDNMYTTSTPGRLTVVTPGLYFIEGQMRYANDPNGTYRAGRIQMNANTDIDTQYVPLTPNNSTHVYLKGWRQCVAGDYFQVSGLHNYATGSIALQVGTAHYTYLRARFINA